MSLFTTKYQLNSFLLNSQGNLGLYHLLNLLQDSATAHAQHIGIGAKEMEEMGLFWVLTRQNVKVIRWPKGNDELTITTWIRGEEGAVSANRDFRFYLGSECIGEATTTWLTLSSQTRKPVIWDRSKVGGFLHADKVELETSKIPVQNETEKLISFGVRNSDIDQNHHVNNTKYTQWILDAIPFDDHYKFTLNQYQVNFIAETKLNDEIRIERKGMAEDRVHFQGIRLSDERAVFTAMMVYQPK